MSRIRRTERRNAFSFFESAKGRPVAGGMPQRLIHGMNDDIVPIEISRRYRDAKQKLGEAVKLVEVANAGHFDLIDPRTEAWKTVQSSLQELLPER